MNKEELHNYCKCASNEIIRQDEQIRKLESKIDKATKIACEYGEIEGDQHKLWVIDQILRILLDERYQDFIENYKKDNGYTWDIGIAP